MSSSFSALAILSCASLNRARQAFSLLGSSLGSSPVLAASPALAEPPAACPVAVVVVPVAFTGAEAGATSDLGPLVLRSSSVITLFGFGASFFVSRAFLAASATASPVCCWEEPCCCAATESPARHRAGTITKAFIQNLTRMLSYLPEHLEDPDNLLDA